MAATAMTTITTMVTMRDTPRMGTVVTIIQGMTTRATALAMCMEARTRSAS